VSRSQIIEWREAVWAAQLSGPTKAIGQALGSWMNARLECYPGIRAISRKASYSPRQVKRAIANLEDAGLLVVSRGYGTATSSYRGVMPDSHRSGDSQARSGDSQARSGDSQSPKSAKSAESGPAERARAVNGTRSACKECDGPPGHHLADCPTLQAVSS
jgi:hypothetical protein